MIPRLVRLRIATAVAAGAVGLVAACTSAQLATAGSDLSAACVDWNAAEGLAQPFAAVPAVGITISIVGGVCAGATLLESTPENVAWLAQATANLKAVTAQAKTGTP